jgi:ankyrin repeat protein
LEKLPKGSEAYDHAYKEAMERIEGQKPGFQELAKQVLSWITFARRPLTTLELRHAFAVEIGESEFDEENLPEIEDMISVCAGLVTVDEESDIIRLVHYTTQDYFERTQRVWFPDVQRDIVTTCATYLSFDAFETGFCSTNEEFEARLRLNPLYDYAAQNWGYHARIVSTEVERSVLALLESEANVSASNQAMMASEKYRYGDYSQEVPKNVTGVHLAAYFGLEEITSTLLKKGYQSDCKDTNGRTPLSWAAESGHEAVVRLLLATDGVDSDSKDLFGQTPLSRAAGNGHEAVVKLLLAQDGVDPDSKDDKYGRTPLSRAAEYGYEAVVKLLLATDPVDPDSKDNGGWTPLFWAAEKGHEAVVKLLLAMNGIDPDSKDNDGGTPLAWAAGNGHEVVVKLLVETGAVVNAHDREYRNMLQAAAYNGKHILMQLLTGNEIDPDVQSDMFQDALQLGCIKGHMTVVEQLISLGANPNKIDEHGWTPLLCASWFGEAQIQDYLLSNGGDRDLLSHASTVPPNSWSRIDRSTRLHLDENSRCVQYSGN